MANIGGLSMRRGLPTPPRFTKKDFIINNIVGLKRRKTGLLGVSGTLNNNI